MILLSVDVGVCYVLKAVSQSPNKLHPIGEDKRVERGVILDSVYDAFGISMNVNLSIMLLASPWM